MSTIFKFRMLSDENDYFIREYEVPGDIKLIEFNDFICDDLRFDKDCVTSFFTSNALWEKEREFTRLDMGAPGNGQEEGIPVPMGDVLLNGIVRRNRDRLIFLFDVFDDRCLYLELIGEKKRTDDVGEYPRTALSRGDSPKQFDSGKSGIFDDMMGDFDTFESYETDDFGDDY